MKRVPLLDSSSASLAALVILAMLPRPAQADATPQCNDGPGFNSTECGSNATATGQRGTAVGQVANAAALNTTATGFNSQATQTNSTVNGANSAATGLGSTAIGAVSEASGDRSTTLGEAARALASFTTSVGSFSTAFSFSGTAIGNSAAVRGTGRRLGNVALGAGSDDGNASTRDVVSVGNDGSNAAGAFTRAITNVSAGIIGAGSTDAVTGDQLFTTNTNVARAQTTADAALARSTYVAVGGTGVTPTANGTGAVAIGIGQKATGNGAVAIGDPNVATGTGAVAIGANNTALGNGAVAIGNGTTANGTSAIALGDGANATQPNSVAIGLGATATRASQVVLGTAGSSYTLAGVASESSRSAQIGTIKYVTSDIDGNLGYSSFGPTEIANLQSSVGSLQGQIGTLQGQINAVKVETRQSQAGIAAAMALGGTVMPPDSRFAISFNLATYRGEQGFSGAAVGRLSKHVWVSGGFAGSTVKGSTGGRVGMTFGW